MESVSEQSFGLITNTAAAPSFVTEPIIYKLIISKKLYDYVLNAVGTLMRRATGPSLSVNKCDAQPVRTTHKLRPFDWQPGKTYHSHTLTVGTW